MIDTSIFTPTMVENNLLNIAVEDMVDLERSIADAANYFLGVDVSRHQGPMDWKKCAARGVTFAAIRVTVGNYYTDPRFEENWQGAKAAGLLVTAYHVVTPEYSVRSQMERFRAVIGGHWPDLPPVLDCELTRGQDKDIVTARIEGCAQAVINWGMARPIIYTRQSWWDHYVLPSYYWDVFPLWVANYTDAPQPLLPRDWTTWKIWQYSSKGDGPKYGAESKSIDLNRMAGQLPGVEPPDPEPELSEMIRTNTPSARLFVRTAPTVKDATAIGLVRNGTVFRTVRRDGAWVVVEAYVHGDYVEPL